MEKQANFGELLLSSAIASGVAEIVTYPCCTLTTNYVNGAKSLRATFTKISSQGGFYKGCGLAVGAQILTTSLKFSFYEKIKHHFENKNLFSKITSGVVSGMSVSILTHPIDVFRVTRQMQKSPLLLLKRDGFVFLYRGYSKTLLKNFLGAASFLPIRDSLRESGMESMCADLITAGVSTLIMHPAYYLKTRQIFEGRSISFTNLFKGLPMNLCRTVPHFFITMQLTMYLQK